MYFIDVSNALLKDACVSEASILLELAKNGNAQKVPTVEELRKILYGLHSQFARCIKFEDAWRRAEFRCNDCVEMETPTNITSNALKLREPYPWQTQALNEWQIAHNRGIIEAITGSGKTQIGLIAIKNCLELGSKSLILVPTLELADQWYAQLMNYAAKSVAVGRLGGGYRGSLRTCDVLVAIVNSARNLILDHPSTEFDLLVADECHRYGTPENAKALKSCFTHRLGLSATVQRNDNGTRKYLIPFFGSIVYRYTYQHARIQDVIAPFHATFLGVALSEIEEQYYREMSDEIGVFTRQFIKKFQTKIRDLSDFIQILCDAAKQHYDHIDMSLSFLATRLLSLLAERRRFLERLPGKFHTLRELSSVCEMAKGTLVFTQSIESAETAASVLRQRKVRAISIHSETPMILRRQSLEQFRRREISTIVAPKILDEGIDVPEANLAIIMTATRSKRQVIQRIGRVLRKKNDGSAAELIVMYVENTIEDPDQGAHESVIADIKAAANSTKIVTSAQFAAAVADSVAGWMPHEA